MTHGELLPAMIYSLRPLFEAPRDNKPAQRPLTFDSTFFRQRDDSSRRARQ